ncbi:MAG: DUF3426 domain-containing protein [Burkholderiaceae bacterium]
MALATTCPTCKTSFKVNPDQLKLRKGLVRCGKCQHVFSGIQYLRYVSESRGKRAKKSRPAQASVVAPETVAEDLNTAFFLPETQFAPDTTVRQAGAGQTDTPKSESESESHSRHPRHSGSPIKSPIEVQASGSEPGIASTVAPVAASDTPNEANTADSSRSRKSRRANRRKNRRRRNKATTVGVAAPDDNYDTQDSDATDFDDTVADTTVDTPVDSVDTVAQPTSPAETTRTRNPDPAPDTEPFEDTLQANLPQAWQTTTSWPEVDEDLVKKSLPSRPGDNPTSPGTRTSTPRHEATSVSTQNRKPGHATGHLPNLSGDEPSEPAHWLDDVTDAADRAIADDDEEDAIDFFGQTSRPVFDFDLPPRSVWITAAALAFLLTFQLALGARDSLAALFPAAKPILESISNPLGLSVELPLKPEAIRIESHDLANAPARDGKAAYVLNLLIRNHENINLRWPAIELTLTDRTGANILVRKALMPGDYLSDPTLAIKGMPALSEKAVRLKLQAKGIVPMHGYTAVLFYP